MVLQILEHDFSDTENKLWLVQWHGDDAPSNTWENLSTLKDVEAFHQYCATHRLNAFLPKEHPQFSASKPSTQRRKPEQFATPQVPVEEPIGPTTEKRKRGRPAKQHATVTGSADTDQGQAAKRWYLTAAAISEEEKAEDLATGGQDDTQGGVRTRATRAQMDTMRAKREREELQMGNLQRHGDTEEPQREVTTMVVYLGVTHAEDPVTGEQDDAHGGTLEVTEDA